VVFGSVRINGGRTIEQGREAGKARERPLTGKGSGAGDTSWRAGWRGKRVGGNLSLYISRFGFPTHVGDAKSKGKTCELSL